MVPLDFFLVLAIYFLAAVVKGLTGIGFSAVCLALLVVLFDLLTALPLLLIPSVASNLLVMREAGHFRETLDRFRVFFLSQIPGVLLGLCLLNQMDGRLGSSILGSVLMLYGGWMLSAPSFPPISHKLESLLSAPMGMIAGLIHGLTGSQVMPSLPYLLALNLDPQRFIQAINSSFTVSSLILSVGLVQLEIMTTQTVILSLIGLPAVHGGIKIGTYVRRKVAPERFRQMVLISVVVMGGAMIGRNAP